MTRATGPVVIGVDFGTSNTVAALAVPGRAPRILSIDGSSWLPSAVFLTDDGGLTVGRDAERRARLAPERFEPNPKRRIDDGEMLLGSAVVPVEDAIAAVLRRVAEEAQRQLDGRSPDVAVLSHPARWGSTRRAALTSAARRAGLAERVTLVPEPVAAAVHFGSLQDAGERAAGASVGGRPLAVYDLGGGTFDCAVVTTADGRYAVAADDGLIDVGGVDFDQAVLDHLGRTSSAAGPNEWRNLLRPQSSADRRAARAIAEDVRSAKETLSRYSQAEVPLPQPFSDALISRNEFEGLIRPMVIRTVDVLARTIDRAGVTPRQLAGIYLVGGSSRIPLVATEIGERIGVVPTTLDQPEATVALGAALWASVQQQPAAAAPPIGATSGPSVAVLSGQSGQSGLSGQSGQSGQSGPSAQSGTSAAGPSAAVPSGPSPAVPFPSEPSRTVQQHWAPGGPDRSRPNEPNGPNGPGGPGGPGGSGGPSGPNGSSAGAGPGRGAAPPRRKSRRGAVIAIAAAVVAIIAATVIVVLTTRGTPEAGPGTDTSTQGTGSRSGTSPTSSTGGSTTGASTTGASTTTVSSDKVDPTKCKVDTVNDQGLTPCMASFAGGLVTGAECTIDPKKLGITEEEAQAFTTLATVWTACFSQDKTKLAILFQNTSGGSRDVLWEAMLGAEPQLTPKTCGSYIGTESRGAFVFGTSTDDGEPMLLWEDTGRPLLGMLRPPGAGSLIPEAELRSYFEEQSGLALTEQACTKVLADTGVDATDTNTGTATGGSSTSAGTTTSVNESTVRPDDPTKCVDAPLDANNMSPCLLMLAGNAPSLKPTCFTGASLDNLKDLGEDVAPSVVAGCGFTPSLMTATVIYLQFSDTAKSEQVFAALAKSGKKVPWERAGRRGTAVSSLSDDGRTATVTWTFDDMPVVVYATGQGAAGATVEGESLTMAMDTFWKSSLLPINR
ncbi:Hsp70 family protein [Nakamurella lactea]|uniref:Hsp70 family protein n=1 Tax=Nakamurella lactea TaxID=459515 RepID=UPI00040C6DCB|nr:Hsp70 family protein [Nakamurella lactea]